MPREDDLRPALRRIRASADVLRSHVQRADGQLFYPVSPDPGKPWVPEVYGDAILVNGKLLPHHDVEPRKYRLRLMNGSNGRFYRLLALSNDADVSGDRQRSGIARFARRDTRLPLAPAERADIVVDFAPFAGSNVELVSDAFDILAVPRRAKQRCARRQPACRQLRPVRTQPRESMPCSTRRLTLDEHMNKVQQSMGMLLNNTPWHMPVTEKPVSNTTEIWELVNLTDDSHPIHLHLVRFQILDRRRFDVFDLSGQGNFRFTGPAHPPEAFESGWKDTVRADPGHDHAHSSCPLRAMPAATSGTAISSSTKTTR